MGHHDGLRGGRSDNISRAFGLLAAPPTAADHSVRAIYIAKARTLFAVERDRLAELELLLLAREAELARTAPPSEPKP